MVRLSKEILMAFWSKDKNNVGKEFRYEIDINRPNKEKKNE